MTDIIPITAIAGVPAMAAAFGYQEGDLTDGASLGFPVLSYRGKVWRLVHKQNETKLMTPDGDPIPSVRLVILKASSNLSNIFYEKRYSEGDSESPDCYSMDGITPDAGVKSPQCQTCAACPQAAWGSRVSDDGKELKACQNSRRLVVVPANDITNEAMGGPMLLRVPAASLGNLVAYDDRLKKAGVAYFGVATKVSFDLDVSYPKLTFDYDGTATANLDANDGKNILEMRDGESSNRILATMSKTEHGAEEAPVPAKQPAKQVVQPPVQEVVQAAATIPEPEIETPPLTSVGTVEEAASATDVDSLVSGLLG